MLDKCRFKLDLHVLDNNKGFFLIIFSKKRGFGGGGEGGRRDCSGGLDINFF